MSAGELQALGRDDEETAVVGAHPPDRAGRAVVEDLTAEAFAPPVAEGAGYPVAWHEDWEAAHGEAV